MTQSTNTIVPMQADSTVTIPPYRIVGSSLVNPAQVTIGNGTTAGNTYGFIGVTGELGIDAGTVGDVVVAGIGYVQMTQNTGVPIGTPVAAGPLGQGIPVPAGTAIRYVGFLLEPVVTLGQICKILVCPGVY